MPPAPKLVRTASRKAIEYVLYRRDGICMIGLARPGKYGPCIQGLHPHHIATRGSGGGDRKENLISLCPYHHDLAQSHRIPVEELHDILAERFGYEYE